jgi:glycosyltransferase involved in cell wall biosynthesis
MTSPRILFVGTFPPHPGGTGVIAGYLLKGLHEFGYPLSVVTPSSPETADRVELVQRVYPGIALTEVPAARATIMPWSGRMDDPERLAQATRMQVACAKEASRYRPDVVFVGREFYLESVLPWAKARDLPVICRAPGSAQLLDGVFGAAPRRFVLDLMGQVDRIIAPARHVAAGLANHGLSNVATIQNPVDMMRFRPAPIDRELAARLGLRPEHIVVAHASNLKPVKRVDDIVAAAAPAVIRDPRLVFLIIGEGPNRTKMEEAVLRLDLSDHFRFTGWVDHAAVAAHLRLADMALMPSSTEGLAAAYLEAMATCLPLLASDIASAREVIDDGVNGFLFPVGDVASIANSIVDLAADPDLRHRVGANARDYVEHSHSLQAANDTLRKVLADLVEQSGAVNAP